MPLIIESDSAKMKAGTKLTGLPDSLLEVLYSHLRPPHWAEMLCRLSHECRPLSTHFNQVTAPSQSRLGVPSNAMADKEARKGSETRNETQAVNKPAN